MQAILVFTTLLSLASVKLSHQELVLGTYDPYQTKPVPTKITSTTENPCKEICRNMNANIIQCLKCYKENMGQDLGKSSKQPPQSVAWSRASIPSTPKSNDISTIEPTSSSTPPKDNLNIRECMICLRKNIALSKCKEACEKWVEMQSKITATPLRVPSNLAYAMNKNPCKEICRNMNSNIIQCLKCYKESMGQDLGKSSTQPPQSVDWLRASIPSTPKSNDISTIEPTSSSTPPKDNLNIRECMICLRKNIAISKCKEACEKWVEMQSKTTAAPLRVPSNLAYAMNKSPCKEICRTMNANIIQCLKCYKENMGQDLGKSSTQPPQSVDWSRASIPSTPKSNDISTIEPTSSSTPPKDNLNIRECMICLRKNIALSKCKQACEKWVEMQSKTTATPLRVPSNLAYAMNSETSVINNNSKERVQSTIPESQQMLDRLLQYKEREFWFLAFAAGCIIVLLALITIVLITQRRKKQKIVEPRIF